MPRPEKKPRFFDNNGGVNMTENLNINRGPFAHEGSSLTIIDFLKSWFKKPYNTKEENSKKKESK
jgi:hypothetical protein